jgi:hypothetical protein
VRKSIILAAAIAVAALTQSAVADARGLRIGVGFGAGSGSGGPSPLADPTILQNAQRIKERQAQRRQDAAAAAAAARERRSQAAAAREARRQAERAAQSKRREAAAKASPPAVAPRPNVVAVPATPAPAAMTGSDKAMEAAQEEQRAKAEQILKALERARPTAVPATAAAPVVQPPRQAEVVAPAPAGPAEPARVQVVPVPASTSVPAKAPQGGECRRFIPGAGVTVKVSCSE